jgi:hypothetical protein
VGAELQGTQHILMQEKVVKLLSQNAPYTVKKGDQLNQLVNPYTLFMCKSSKSSSAFKVRLLLTLHARNICKLQIHAYK